MKPRHFLTLLDMTPQELGQLIHRAIELKSMHRRGERHAPLEFKVLGMIFEKASTRTRISFEAGVSQLGGSAIFLRGQDCQFGRGESLEDTARVLSRMVDLVMIRTFEHDTVTQFAAHSAVPVINGLTDLLHPCQLLADMQTFVERCGDIRGKTVVWIGDGNNVCNTYITAAKQFDFRLRIACPEGYEPDNQLLASFAQHVEMIRDPMEAARGAHLVATDVWTSMGDENEQEQRLQDFRHYRVDADVMAVAHPDSIFLHCLPAHRGEEVSTDVIDGVQSGVWDEAENRLHAQKALMEFLLLRKL